MIAFVLMVMLGIYCIFNMPIDMYPDMEIPYIIVITKYENADPEEIEKAVSRILEGSLSGVSGLKKLQSQSKTGMSLMILEFEYGVNLDVAGTDVRDKIDMVRTNLPDECDSPITIKLDPSMMPIMTLVVTGERTPDEISQYVEDIVQPQLEQLDGVASATMSGNREKIIAVNIPKDRLSAYDLTLTQVAQMIGAQNITSSGGKIAQGDLNYSVSTEGDYSTVNEIKETVVTYKQTSVPGKTPETVAVTLRDIADVYKGYKKAESLAFQEFTPCVMLSVQKQSGKNSVAIAKRIRKAMPVIESYLPHDVEIIETSNSTDEIENAILEVVNSIVQGTLLALIVLFIFLRNFKSTFVVGISMPVSLVITLMLMYFSGITLNMMSLSGLLLGIGMLVDNSIVVLENIYSYQERDTKAIVAADLGSQEMAGAITSSTLTSVCIFLPMIMFNSMLGMMGQLFNAFAFAIVFSLMCSLFVALVLIPVLTSKYLKSENVHVQYKNPIMANFDSIMQRFFAWLDNAYASRVAWVLDHKKVFGLTIVVLFVLALMSTKAIGFIYIPENASNTVQVDLEMPQGTKLEASQEVIQQLQSNVLDEVKGVKYSTVSVGSTSMAGSDADTYKASLILTLYKKAEREPGWDSDTTAKAKIRKYFHSFPDAKFTFSSGQNGPSTDGVKIQVASDNLDACREISKQIRMILENDPDCQACVEEVTQDLKDGLPQEKIILDRNRMAELGVTSASVANEIKACIDGMTASRYDDEGDQIDIIVSLPDEDKTKFVDMEQIYVTSSTGKRVPIISFAKFEENLAPVTIYRESQRRTITVTAKPIKGKSLGDINTIVHEKVNAGIVPQEGVFISFSGDFDDMVESATKFLAIIIMAALLVFAVMAAQFESFKDPFIVLFTIPLSFIGVCAIYFMTGSTFSIVTVIGMLMLVGTIVNNGIVLVDYTNMLRKRGYALREACVEACGNRLRPILMSTLTTITSLIPMAFFPGEGGKMTQPIGLTELGGMTFGSIMTLFLMPVLYYLFNIKGEKKKLAQEAANKLLAQQAKEAVVAAQNKRNATENIASDNVDSTSAVVENTTSDNVNAKENTTVDAPSESANKEKE